MTTERNRNLRAGDDGPDRDASDKRLTAQQSVAITIHDDSRLLVNRHRHVIPLYHWLCWGDSKIFAEQCRARRLWAVAGGAANYCFAAGRGIAGGRTGIAADGGGTIGCFRRNDAIWVYTGRNGGAVHALGRGLGFARGSCARRGDGPVPLRVRSRLPASVRFDGGNRGAILLSLCDRTAGPGVLDEGTTSATAVEPSVATVRALPPADDSISETAVEFAPEASALPPPVIVMVTTAEAISPDEFERPSPAATSAVAWLPLLAFALEVAPLLAMASAVLTPEATAVALFGPRPNTSVEHSVPSIFVLVSAVVFDLHDSLSDAALAQPIEMAKIIAPAVSEIEAIFPLIEPSSSNTTNVAAKPYFLAQQRAINRQRVRDRAIMS